MPRALPSERVCGRRKNKDIKKKKTVAEWLPGLVFARRPPGSISGSEYFFYSFFHFSILISSRILSSYRGTNVLRAERSAPNVPEAYLSTKGAPRGGPGSS